MKVVVINGRGGSGKDTFVDMCKSYGYIRAYSSVDTIKQAARILGWTEGKSPSDRKFLSELKDLATWYNDGPFEDMKRYHKVCAEENSMCKSMSGVRPIDILFLFVREPREIERCVKEFDAVTLLVRRPANSNEKYGNHADDDVEKYKYDYICDNDGTFAELSEQARAFVNMLTCEEYDTNRDFLLGDVDEV